MSTRFELHVQVLLDIFCGVSWPPFFPNRFRVGACKSTVVYNLLVITVLHFSMPYPGSQSSSLLITGWQVWVTHKAVGSLSFKSLSPS